MACIITYNNKKYTQPEFNEYFKSHFFEFAGDFIGSKKDLKGFKQFVNKPVFDKELAQKIQDKLQELYPEIKLNITNNPIWEQGDNILNQEVDLQNKVGYSLRAIEILNSDKAKQVFEKGRKANWDLNKILTELQIPKDQKEIVENIYNDKINNIIKTLEKNCE